MVSPEDIRLLPGFKKKKKSKTEHFALNGNWTHSREEEGDTKDKKDWRRRGLYLRREKGVVTNFSLRDAIPIVLAQGQQNTYF